MTARVFTKWVDTVPGILQMLQVLSASEISASYLLCGLRKIIISAAVRWSRLGVPRQTENLSEWSVLVFFLQVYYSKEVVQKHRL